MKVNIIDACIDRYLGNNQSTRLIYEKINEFMRNREYDYEPYLFMNKSTMNSFITTVSPLNISEETTEEMLKGRVAKYNDYKIFENNDLEYGELEIR